MNIDATMYHVLFGLYLIVSMALGGAMARYRMDYVDRGVGMAVLGGLFAPVVMYFSPPSQAREGEKTVWPHASPEATILNVTVFGIGYFWGVNAALIALPILLAGLAVAMGLARR